MNSEVKFWKSGQKPSKQMSDGWLAAMGDVYTTLLLLMEEITSCTDMHIFAHIKFEFTSVSCFLSYVDACAFVFEAKVKQLLMNLFYRTKNVKTIAFFVACIDMPGK